MGRVWNVIQKIAPKCAGQVLNLGRLAYRANLLDIMEKVWLPVPIPYISREARHLESLVSRANPLHIIAKL